MSHRDSFEASSNHEISYELLYFLQWLVEHDQEQEMLKRIIFRAMQGGLRQKLARNTHKVTANELHQGIFDFFAILESLLFETVHEHATQKMVRKNLTKILRQIDSTACDERIVQRSIDKTTSQVEEHPDKNPKTILYKELLRSWRPSKKTSSN